MERRRRQRQDRDGRVRGALPDRHLAPSTTGRADSAAQYGIFASQRAAARASGRTPTRATSTTPATTSARAAAVQPDDRPRLDRQYSALGYSGTNSGGALVVKNSEFDHNKDGFDTNSQNNDDAPSPAGRRLPERQHSPITHTTRAGCSSHNYVHDNNNPNVPGRRAPSAGPGRDRDLDRRRALRHGHRQPLRRTTAPGASCSSPTPTTRRRRRPALPGRTADVDSGFGCMPTTTGATSSSTTSSPHNGFFGNPTNSDFGEITSQRQPDQLLSQATSRPTAAAAHPAADERQVRPDGHRRPEPGS